MLNEISIIHEFSQILSYGTKCEKSKLKNNVL